MGPGIGPFSVNEGPIVVKYDCFDRGRPDFAGGHVFLRGHFGAEKLELFDHFMIGLYDMFQLDYIPIDVLYYSL